MSEIRILVEKISAPTLTQPPVNSAPPAPDKLSVKAVELKSISAESQAQTPEADTEKLREANSLNNKQLADAVVQIKDYTQSVERKLDISVDELSGRSVITVLDRETDTVIRQIPSEDILDMIHYIETQKDEGNTGTGLFIKEQV